MKSFPSPSYFAILMSVMLPSTVAERDDVDVDVGLQALVLKDGNEVLPVGVKVDETDDVEVQAETNVFCVERERERSAARAVDGVFMMVLTY